MEKNFNANDGFIRCKGDEEKQVFVAQYEIARRRPRFIKIHATDKEAACEKAKRYERGDYSRFVHMYTEREYMETLFAGGNEE